MLGFRNLKVGVKIGLGFALVTFILMGVVLTTIQHVKKMESLSERLYHLRTPTAHASLMMLNGMNHSLASLRGWIILGDEKFKKERHLAWEEQIRPSLETMRNLSSKWTDKQNVEHLKFIETRLVDFEKFQKEIENIAQTEENTPARKILFNVAEPLEEILARNISKMIRLELKIPSSSQRKELMGYMADMEGNISLSMEKVEEFLLSGDVRFKKAFEESWKINLQRMGQIARLSAMLTPEQKVAFKKISRSIKKLGPSLNKIVHIRSNGKWNIANLWLGEKAAPAASEIKVRLNTMTESQNSLLQEDMDAISSETHRLIILLIISFFVGALISGVLGSAITQAVSRPIKNVSHMARELAAGNLRQKKLPVESRDELGDLSESFNQLLDRLKKIQPFGKPLSK